jgi:hypothetical protein
MKNLMARWILCMGMLFAFAASAMPARAQVVVAVGPNHPRYYHHHHYYHHVYYRHGHRYYR